MIVSRLVQGEGISKARVQNQREFGLTSEQAELSFQLFPQWE